MKFNFSRHFSRNLFLGNLWMSLARKEYLAVALIAFMCAGCQSVKRLTDGADATPPAPPKVIVGGNAPITTNAPDFNVPTPSGYKRTVFFGALPLDGVVHVTADPSALVNVFMMQLNIHQWFLIDDHFNEAYYDSFDPATGTVKYIGQHLDGIEYCVYEYTKVTP